MLSLIGGLCRVRTFLFFGGTLLCIMNWEVPTLLTSSFVSHVSSPLVNTIDVSDRLSGLIIL